MSTSSKKFIHLRTIFRSQHIIENDNRSFVFVYWFYFITCFINWILIGRSSYYMNRSLVTYFFKYFQHIICFTYVAGADKNLAMVFICWNIIVNIIDFFISHKVISFSFLFVNGIFFFYLYCNNSYIYSYLFYNYLRLSLCYKQYIFLTSI